MQRFLVLLARATAAALLVAVGCAQAAGDPDPPTPDKLSAARARIAEKQWPAAIEALKGVNDTGSAEWNNLMGYSLRKQATPDYAAAERHYDEALRIDPKHRGALEYSGELYLITGNLPKAEARLAALDKACLFSCEEYRDLKRAIERYKAAGNKYVASP
jgi:tetratricopeptide (TPR) repeat protein